MRRLRPDGRERGWGLGGLPVGTVWGRQHDCWEGLVGKATGVFIEGTARYMGEMSRRNRPDRSSILASIQPCLGHREAVHCHVVIGYSLGWGNPYKYQVYLGFEHGPRRC